MHYLSVPTREATPPLPFKHSLDLRNLVFSYPEAKEAAIKKLNLSLKANSSIAFVGSTGSGKTTLVDIILGLLTPDEGELAVDGVAITPKNVRNWQRNLGYVPQHIYLSDNSIAQNIAFGIPKDKIDLTAVEKAARIANLHDFIINDLPGGYETIVGERGIRLSGGQRQRIGIARALYHDPAVLILDEATSALDNVTEESVFEAIRNVAKSKTAIMIAHRISTVRDCDVIYVIEQGRIVSQGSYEELLGSSDRFRALAQAGAGR
jgi:ATP-binding cassette, subfamily B, bacterial PglK